MEPPTDYRTFPSLEDRIASARAERSIAVGAAMGNALAALWRVLSSLPFSPERSGRLPPHR